MQAWFVVATKPRSEAVALGHLTRQGYVCYLPRVRRAIRTVDGMRDRTECLFPSYLFLFADPEHESLAPVRSTRGAIGLVRFGGQPAQVPAEVIQRIRAREDTEDGLVRLAAVEIKAGSRVCIKDGPMSGIDGIFLGASGVDRVRLLLDLLGTMREVVLPRQQIAVGI